MKLYVSRADIEHGRGLLRACADGREETFEIFWQWQREHFGVSSDYYGTWWRSVQAGNMSRAERMFDAVADPLIGNGWHYTIGRAARIAVLIAIAAVIYLWGKQ